jgi:alcohol dehydrogenase class IV
MLAALLGGIAISSRWLGAAHSLAHQLSSFADVHHGLACSLMLPHQMAFSLPAASERYAQIAVALDPETDVETGFLGRNPVSTARAEAAVEAVCRLVDAIGLPTRLRDVGVTEAMIPDMARHAYIDLNWTTNPRPVTEGDLEMLYRQAY